MCDSPTTYQEALNAIVELEGNFRRHEKSMKTAAANLNEAKVLILAEYEDTPVDEGIMIRCLGGEISLSKARKTQALDNKEASLMLEDKQEGLAFDLAKYAITDVREWLSPKEIDSISTDSYGARTFKIKVNK